MPLQLSQMPSATPYDPTADAAGSADPIGTLGGSERLAEVLLPGLTARMWRARLLTFAVVAADVADAIVRQSGDEEDLRLRARLAFERLFVSGLVRCEESDPGRYSGVPRRVPGRRVASRALHADDEPLTRQNFIKGQAVNGPSGIIARLAHHLGLLDDVGRVAGCGHDLRSAWARGADAGDADSPFSGSFYDRALGAVTDYVNDGSWPKARAPLWSVMVDALRPDRIPSAERRVIIRLFSTEPEYGIRPRVLELLRDQRCVRAYDEATADSRGAIERAIMLDGIRPLLGKDVVDHHIAVAIRTINAYEEFSSVFADLFNVILWSLRAAGGNGSLTRILHPQPVVAAMKRYHGQVPGLCARVRAILPEIAHCGPFEAQGIPALMSQVLQDAERGVSSIDDLVNSVLTRHDRVQREKHKPIWVDRSATWTLMPGTPVNEEPWRKRAMAFVHPCRLVNAYAIMNDLQLIKAMRFNGDDDGE